MIISSKIRPVGATLLSIFFSLGALISFTVSISLSFPGSFLEPIWRLNPHAHESFVRIGVWAVLLMFAVGVSCAMAASGLWRGARWGYWLASVLLVINLIGDVANVVLGTEPGTIVGVPIVIAILTYLTSRRVRRFFNQG